LFSACFACHSLKPGEGNRAGPTLHGMFGRRIATLQGYDLPKALKMDQPAGRETSVVIFHWARRITR
jgi:cytochrome c